jgi:hypothetical protein
VAPRGQRLGAEATGDEGIRKKFLPVDLPFSLFLCPIILYSKKRLFYEVLSKSV